MKNEKIKVEYRAEQRCEAVRPSLDGTFVWACTNLMCDGVNHYMQAFQVAS